LSDKEIAPGQDFPVLGLSYQVADQIARKNASDIINN
jgi:hypothetical protein